jgi:hypothetical protein
MSLTSTALLLHTPKDSFMQTMDKTPITLSKIEKEWCLKTGAIKQLTRSPGEMLRFADLLEKSTGVGRPGPMLSEMRHVQIERFKDHVDVIFTDKNGEDTNVLIDFENVGKLVAHIHSQVKL